MKLKVTVFGALSFSFSAPGELIGPVFFLLSYFSGPFATAAVQCHDLFITPPAFYQEAKFTSQLVKLGYKIEFNDFNKPLISKKKDGEWIELGEIVENATPYTFEWATKKDRDSFMKRGIDQAALDAIIKDDGQALGKGFYVSTHPVDSRMFGNYLTIFKLDRPLRMIISGSVGGFANDEATILELQNLGFDAIGVYRYINWYSVISTTSLSHPVDLTAESFEYLLKHYDDEYNSAKMEPESNFKKIFKEKSAFFASSLLSKQILKKKKDGIKLTAIDKKFDRLLNSTL